MNMSCRTSALLYIPPHQVLDRCSALTFAAYLPHKGEAWLFLEAPHGLPSIEETGIYVHVYILTTQFTVVVNTIVQAYMCIN